MNKNKVIVLFFFDKINIYFILRIFLLYKDKNQFLNYTIVIILFLIILFSIAFIFTDFKDFLTGNLTPELIGIAIELLIIIWGFELWQRKKEYNKNIVNEKRLREYLLFFLKHGFKDFPVEHRVTTFYGQNHKQSSKEIQNAIIHLKSEEIESLTLLEMKKLLLIDKTAIENLLEVASLLTDKHFKAWIRIVYYINLLSTISNDNEEKIKEIIIAILQQINNFDDASYTNNIYVGANNSLGKIDLKIIFKTFPKWLKFITMVTFILLILLFSVNSTKNLTSKLSDETVKKVNKNELIKKFDPIFIFFDKNSILINNNNLPNFNNIFNKNNIFIIKITGFSSMESLKNKNSFNDNYQLSIARASNVKKLVLDYIDNKNINRHNIIVDTFANSNQSILSISHHNPEQMRKVEIEIIELKSSN
jgi:hypothetical protein